MNNPYQIHNLSADWQRDVEPMLNYLVEQAVNNNLQIVSHTIYVNPEDNRFNISVITKAKEPNHV